MWTASRVLAWTPWRIQAGCFPLASSRHSDTVSRSHSNEQWLRQIRQTRYLGHPGDSVPSICPLSSASICLPGDLPIPHAQMVIAQGLWAKFTIKRHFATEIPCPTEMQDMEVEALVLKGVSVLRGPGTLLWGSTRDPHSQKRMQRISLGSRKGSWMR